MGNLIKSFTQRKRIEKALPHIKGSVLDVGCGNRKLKEYVEYEYMGYDLSEGWDVEKDAYLIPSNSYDHVVLLAVIEHLVQPMTALEQCMRIARKNVILTTPRRESEKFVVLYSPNVVHQHTHYFTKQDFWEYPVIHYETFEFGLNQLLIISTGGYL